MKTLLRNAFFFLTFYINKYKKEENEPIYIFGKIIGTTWKINFINKNINKKILIEDIKKQLENDNQELSFWEKNSIISKFNNRKSTYPQKISKNLAKIILTALLIGKKTSNALDITIGTLVNIWGFGPQTPPTNIPNPQIIKNALSLTNLKYLKVTKKNKQYYLQKNKKNIIVDLSTLGEGFIADHLGELLQKKGIKNYTIAVGGAIITHTKNYIDKPKIIAIQKPTDKEIKAFITVKLYNHAISTSGTYRNYYYLKKKIVHLINPNTGNPINHNLVSVSVIAKSALEADAWDTGLMILGFDQAKKIAIKEKLAVCLIKEEKLNLFTWISPQFHIFLKKIF
ncbi:FAD:protein FMN transferase [Buchnera aphidicola]|nr:FAD:protein FMN transferase [Buchnera aphidicola]